MASYGPTLQHGSSRTLRRKVNRRSCSNIAGGCRAGPKRVACASIWDMKDFLHRCASPKVKAALNSAPPPSLASGENSCHDGWSGEGSG